jgi:hypothetical protein
VIRSQKPEARSQKPEGLTARRAEPFIENSSRAKCRGVSGFWFLVSGF